MLTMGSDKKRDGQWHPLRNTQGNKWQKKALLTTDLQLFVRRRKAVDGDSNFLILSQDVGSNFQLHLFGSSLSLFPQKKVFSVHRWIEIWAN